MSDDRCRIVEASGLEEPPGPEHTTGEILAVRDLLWRHGLELRPFGGTA